MGLILLVFGILVVLFVLNMFYVDEEEVDKIRYNQPSIGERITEKEAIDLAKNKYQSKNYKFKSEYHQIIITKKKVLFGFKETTNIYDTNYQEITRNVLSIILMGWIIIVGVFGLSRIWHESVYLQKQNEYNILVAQLERVESYDEQDYVVSGDFGSLEDIYIKAREYNNWVIRNRYWSDNSFMWWFYNKYANELELIAL